METGSSGKCTNTLSQLLIDANGWRLHRLGGLVRRGFVNKKTPGQISRLRANRHFRPCIVQARRFRFPLHVSWEDWSHDSTSSRAPQRLRCSISRAVLDAAPIELNSCSDLFEGRVDLPASRLLCFG